MYVDYMRYYNKNGFNPPSEPALVAGREETVGVFTPPNSTQHAFSQGLNQFPNIEVVVYGAGESQMCLLLELLLTETVPYYSAFRRKLGRRLF